MGQVILLLDSQVSWPTFQREEVQNNELKRCEGGMENLFGSTGIPVKIMLSNIKLLVKHKLFLFGNLIYLADASKARGWFLN